MENKTGTTPAPAATLPSDAAGNNKQPVTPTPPNGAQGNNQEGKVTIDLKEYRDLQRAKARSLSFDKRAQLKEDRGSGAGHQPTNNGGAGDDPEIAEIINQAQTKAAEAERRAMQAEVRGRVRDLLDKEEFKTLAKSTRDLILKNPHMLSSADNVDEALLDIEDYVREHSLSDQGNGGQGTGSRPTAPNHETPPPINNGASAPTSPQGLEDVSKLRGAEKTRALIRNGLRSAKGVIK